MRFLKDDGHPYASLFGLRFIAAADSLTDFKAELLCSFLSSWALAGSEEVQTRLSAIAALGKFVPDEPETNNTLGLLLFCEDDDVRKTARRVMEQLEKAHLQKLNPAARTYF